MISSFESAFVSYLDQHLNEDLYIRFKPSEKKSIEQWLTKEGLVAQYALYHNASAKISTDTVTIRTVNSDQQLQSVVFKTQPTSLDNRVTTACFINEQLALKRNISMANKITLNQADKKSMSCQVNGIYYNYGNPGFAVIIANALAQQHKLSLNEVGFGVYIKGREQDVIDKIVNELNLDPSQIYQSKQIKNMALSIFKQTFILTQAIAAVLLSIACFGLFLSANSLELARKVDLLTLSSLGYSRSALFIHMLMQWLWLAGGCILLSWPAAIVLADALVSKILPASFGWSMPLVVDVETIVSSSLIALSCLLFALYFPLKTISLHHKN